MTDLRQAAQQALEALEERYVGALRDRAIEALEAALAEHDRLTVIEAIERDAGIHVSQQAEPEQEPVAWLWQHSETGRSRVVTSDQIITADATWFVVGPLYLGSAPTPRKPLTNEELLTIYNKHIEDPGWGYERALIAEYEAKQKEASNGS